MAKSRAGLASVTDHHPEFTDWLHAVCEAAGVKTAKLHIFMIREGYDVREETVRRWTLGDAQPPARAVPYMLRALDKAVEGSIDVWKAYEEWLHGRPFRKGSKGSGPGRKTARFRGTPRSTGVSGAGSVDRRTDRHLSVVETD